MATITHRVGNPSNLTAAQVDANFDGLNADAAAAAAAAATAVTAAAAATAAAATKVPIGPASASGLTTAAASVLVGRGAGAAGALQELSLGTNLSMAGNTLNATGGGTGSSTFVGLTDAASADLPTINALLAAALAGKVTQKPNYALTGDNTLTQATHSKAHGSWTGAAPGTQAAPATGTEGDWLENFNGGTANNTFTGVIAGADFTNVCPPGATYEALYSGGAWHSALGLGVSLLAPLNSAQLVTPVITGGVVAAVPLAGDNTVAIAPTAFVTAGLALKVDIKAAALPLTGTNSLTMALHGNRHSSWSGVTTAAQTMPVTDLADGDFIEQENEGTAPVTYTGLNAQPGYKKSAMPGETMFALWDGAQWQSKLQRVNTARVMLPDAATVTLDADLSSSYDLTLGGSHTLANPTNLQDGMFFALWVYQGGAGNWTLTWDSKYKWGASGTGAAPTLATVAGGYNLFTFAYNSYLDILIGNMA